MERPEVVTEDHLLYLDDLRESGETNMFGAGAYVESEFDMNRKDASVVVGYWMRTFSERHPS